MTAVDYVRIDLLTLTAVLSYAGYKSPSKIVIRYISKKLF